MELWELLGRRETLRSSKREDSQPLLLSPHKHSQTLVESPTCKRFVNCAVCHIHGSQFRCWFESGLRAVLPWCDLGKWFIAVVLNPGAILSCPRGVWRCLETFLVVRVGRCSASSTWWVEARGAVLTSYYAQGSPRHKESSGSDVNCSKVKKNLLHLNKPQGWFFWS